MQAAAKLSFLGPDILLIIDVLLMIPLWKSRVCVLFKLAALL